MVAQIKPIELLYDRQTDQVSGPLAERLARRLEVNKQPYMMNRHLELLAVTVGPVKLHGQADRSLFTLPINEAIDAWLEPPLARARAIESLASKQMRTMSIHVIQTIQAFAVSCSRAVAGAGKWSSSGLAIESAQAQAIGLGL